MAAGNAALFAENDYAGSFIVISRAMNDNAMISLDDDAIFCTLRGTAIEQSAIVRRYRDAISMSPGDLNVRRDAIIFGNHKGFAATFSDKGFELGTVAEKDTGTRLGLTIAGNASGPEQRQYQKAIEQCSHSTVDVFRPRARKL